jgi:hypothetical protein
MEPRVDDPDKGPVDAAVDDAVLDSPAGVADSLDMYDFDGGRHAQATMDQAAW